jgi:Uma2 family endonuclease
VSTPVTSEPQPAQVQAPELQTPEAQAAAESASGWQPTPPPTDLIFDDGEPLESNRHRIAMNVLINSLDHTWRDRNDYFTGGNMFIYYSSAQVKNQDFRGPDFFVVLDVEADSSRQGWVVWEEGGRYPDVIVELLSPSTAKVDRGAKKRLYERVFRTSDYFIYDPFDPDSLEGWHLDSARGYQPITPDQRGWCWCETLGLWLGTWQGTFLRETAHWLRLYDSDNNLVLLPEEDAAQLAEQAIQRADQEAQRANQETQRAEQEAQRAEQEAQRAEQEAQRAEQEAQRAEQEAQRAEQERQKAERLAARLRELGEDPSQWES